MQSVVPSARAGLPPGTSFLGDVLVVWPWLLLSACIWTGLYHVSPLISDYLFPVSHPAVRREKRNFNAWHVHMVSQVGLLARVARCRLPLICGALRWCHVIVCFLEKVHCIPVVFLAFWQLWGAFLSDERIFGRSDASTLILLFSAG